MNLYLVDRIEQHGQVLEVLKLIKYLVFWLVDKKVVVASILRPCFSCVIDPKQMSLESMEQE
jgi:hypothetical protein